MSHSVQFITNFSPKGSLKVKSPIYKLYSPGLSLKKKTQSVSSSDKRKSENFSSPKSSAGKDLLRII